MLIQYFGHVLPYSTTVVYVIALSEVFVEVFVAHHGTKKGMIIPPGLSGGKDVGAKGFAFFAAVTVCTVLYGSVLNTYAVCINFSIHLSSSLPFGPALPSWAPPPWP